MLHFVDTARGQNASDRVTYNLWRAMFWGGGCVLRYAVLCCVGGGDGGGGLSDTVLVFHSGLSLTSSEFRT